MAAQQRASNVYHLDGGVGGKAISAPISNPGLGPDMGVGGNAGNGGRRSMDGRISLDSTQSDPRMSVATDPGAGSSGAGGVGLGGGDHGQRVDRNSTASSNAGSIRRVTSRLQTLQEGMVSPSNPSSGPQPQINGYTSPSVLQRRESNTGSIRSVNSGGRIAPEFGGPPQSSVGGDYGRYPPHPSTVRTNTMTSQSSSVGSMNKLRRTDSRQYTPVLDSNQQAGSKAQQQQSFVLNRPEDPAEIEEMYREVAKRRRIPLQLGPLTDMSRNSISTIGSSSRASIINNPSDALTIDKMWEVVYSDRREEVMGRSSKVSAESYCAKFLNGRNDIQVKDMRSLHVTLRTESTKWLQDFLTLSGPQVLAKILSDLYKKR